MTVATVVVPSIDPAPPADSAAARAVAERQPRCTLTFQDLADEALALDALFEMDAGEFTPEAEALANGLMEQLVQKADGYADFLKDMESRAALLREEEDRLATKRKSFENRVSWMKRNAMVAMQRMGRQKIEGLRFTLAMQRNPVAVEVSVLPGALPPEFVRTIPAVLEPDKNKIKEALLANQTIEGCALVQSFHLRIR